MSEKRICPGRYIGQLLSIVEAMTYEDLPLKNLDKSDKKDNNLSSKTHLETTVIALNLSKGDLSESTPIYVVGDTIGLGLRRA